MTKIRLFRDSGDLVYTTNTSIQNITCELKLYGFADVVTTDGFTLILSKETMLLSEV